MKKTLLVFTGILLCLVSLQAQKIKYESSLEKAKSLALQQQKPVAILITIQPPVPSPNFMKGFNDPAVIDKFNNRFINYKVAKEDTLTSRKIISEYKITRFPAFIFLDSKGGLLFKDVALAARPQPLLDMADRAMAGTKEKSLVDLDSVYQAGNKSTAFLKEYIVRRRNADINNNADLIETYVSGLNISDLNKYEEVLFILQAGPLADSNAYRLVLTNKRLVDSIFRHEPLATRVAMNNATIQNTLYKAIADKNSFRAMAAANFARTAQGNNYMEAQKVWQARMLQYYLGVNDTANYLQNAARYYDTYYMQMSLDSVRKKDSMNFERARKNAKEVEVLKVNDSLTRRTVSFSYSKDSYATGLNNAAWNFYKLAGDNNEYLLKAMLWSKRSIEHSPKAAYYDTYAHLLYKLKLFSEAESMQKNAIETAKAEKMDSKGFQKEYEKMKSRTL